MLKKAGFLAAWSVVKKILSTNFLSKAKAEKRYMFPEETYHIEDMMIFFVLKIVFLRNTLENGLPRTFLL